MEVSKRQKYKLISGQGKNSSNTEEAKRWQKEVLTHMGKTQPKQTKSNQTNKTKQKTQTTKTLWLEKKEEKEDKTNESSMAWEISIRKEQKKIFGY